MSDTLDLIATVAELRSRYGSAPNYRRLYTVACDGRIPAERVGKFWQIRRADIPTVAKAFNLTTEKARG